MATMSSLILHKRSQSRWLKLETNKICQCKKWMRPCQRHMRTEILQLLLTKNYYELIVFYVYNLVSMRRWFESPHYFVMLIAGTHITMWLRSVILEGSPILSWIKDVSPRYCTFVKLICQFNATEKHTFNNKTRSKTFVVHSQKHV